MNPLEEKERTSGKEVGDALRSGEKGIMETGGGQSRRGEADFRRSWRGWAKNSLVGNIQEKTMMVEKISSKDGYGYRSQLKKKTYGNQNVEG